MARRVGSFLSSLGWLVIGAKFDRCSEYESREVICSVFDKLISIFVDMKDRSDEKDIEFAARAEEAISDAFESSSLSVLADLIPSLSTILEFIEGKRKPNKQDGHDSLAADHSDFEAPQHYC